MVTKEELASKKFINYAEFKRASYQVTAAEMRRFEANKTLNDKVYKKITDYTKKNNIKPKYEGLEEICQLSSTSLKKSCAGTQKITRYFLYKLTVGLHMSVEEANELFKLCGGVLAEDNIEDFICYKALLDGDDINRFIDEFNSVIKEYDKLQTADKLKKLYE